jgi:hypothetical protein
MKADIIFEEGGKSEKNFEFKTDKVLYYFLFLKDNPGMYNAVQAFLPEGAGYDSGKPSAGPAKRDGRKAKGKDDSTALVAQAIQGIGEAQRIKAVAQQKNMLRGQIDRQRKVIQDLGISLKAIKKRYKELKREEARTGVGMMSQSTADSYSRLVGFARRRVQGYVPRQGSGAQA